MKGLRICSFSGALADLPAKSHADCAAVLDCLREHPRFSVFDATEHAALARTLDKLGATGRLHYLPDEGYPWCRVEVLPPPKSCGACGGRGSTPIIGKHRRLCSDCAGKGFIPAAPCGERREP